MQYKGQTLSFEYYAAAFVEDSKGLGKGLRMMPKITSAHISPSSFEKMRVSLATQVTISKYFYYVQTSNPKNSRFVYFIINTIIVIKILNVQLYCFLKL